MSSRNLTLFILFLLIILATRIFLFYQNRPELITDKDIKLSGVIVTEPTLKGNFQSFQLQIPGGNRIFVTTLADREYAFQEQVSIIGILEKRLLSNNREIYTTFMPEIGIVKNPTSSILAVINLVRQKVISFFNKNLPSDHASLLLGIVFGIRTTISDSFMNDLRSAGVLHVIAASGMNVTLVGGFLSYTLVLFLKRQWAVCFSVLGLIFYAILAGLGPSIIRATIMGILVFSAQILGRQYLAAYGLFLSAFLMLFISPSLISDIGFQLSFLATAGLIYFKPLVDLLFSKVLTKKLFILEDFSTTFAAQAATLPILIFNFGSYSLWSVVINALVLWTIPILMILGGIGAVLGFILEPIGKFFLYLCLPLLWYFEMIVKAFPTSSINLDTENIHWTIIAGYYLILASISLWLKVRPKTKKNENKNS